MSFMINPDTFYFLSRLTCFFSVPESLLSGRVPELQLDFHPGLDDQRAGVEIHADGRVRHVAVDPVREALQQRRLPHRGVPEQDDAELVLPQNIHGMTRDGTPERSVRVSLSVCVCVRQSVVFTWSPAASRCSSSCDPSTYTPSRTPNQTNGPIVPQRSAAVEFV